MFARKFNIFSSVVFWICFAFIIWIFAFRGFLSSKLAIFEDATSYYEHIKFYLENLAQGVYPLWDPFWANGAPNDFFLRRIGAFNPFYSVILLFKCLGISYTLSYLWFFALYYWSGMIAFYLLAMRIYANCTIAYGGYLILLFSSLGTRIFDSYMMLVTVPLLWFFYYLVAFSQTPRKSFFLGACLSFMILASTYIPFYFLCCFLFFMIFYVIFYFKEIPKILSRYLNFFNSNKILVIFSLLLVLFSFFPLISFYHNSNEGQIVLPARHGSAEVGQTLVVPSNTLDWGAVEDILFSSYFADWKTIRFAVIYIPLFAFIVFAFGLFGRLTRRACFLFTCGFVLLCCIVPRGLPFYDFFYKYVFFLKYFRNLHFFLWFALIPLFVLLILEHWKIFSEFKPKPWLSIPRLLTLIWIAHGLASIFIYLRGDAIPSSYLVFFLSAVFWTLFFLGRFKLPALTFGLLTLAVVIQPLEAYYYLSLRAKPYTKEMYSYHFSFTSLNIKEKAPVPLALFSSSKSSLYYASSYYNRVHENISDYSITNYLQYKFILVDKLQVIDPLQVPFENLESYFKSSENKAFVFQERKFEIKTVSNNSQPDPYVQRIDRENKDFKVLAFNANFLRLFIVLPTEKFLVYNDSYDKGWRVFVNGKEVHCYLANLGFKGVWLPAGKSIVEFRYGSWWQYTMNYVLLAGAYLLLIGVVLFSKEKGKIK